MGASNKDHEQIMKNIEEYGQMGTEVLDLITNSSMTSDEKIALLIATKRLFDRGLWLLDSKKEGVI